MNRGDTARFDLAFNVNGVPLQPGYDEIEFQIQPESPKAKKFLLSNGDIHWDEYRSLYYILLTQEDTFSLPFEFSYQIRIKKDGSVTSSDFGYISMGETLSKRVI